ncbi:MAG: CoA ester lyase [Actinomycetota bacterium]|nr:CoA ester lyase [Actinomycetota bacterium]
MARSRRSCLSVPGSSDRMLVKAQELPADELVVDLEDAVVPESKEAARVTAITGIRDGSWGERSVAVRVNPLATEWGRGDVEEVVAGAGEALGSLVVPKVESPAELEALDSLLDDAEKRAGREPLGLQALVETAAGLVRVAEIARASARLEALIIGFADLAASLGRSAGADYPGDRWHWVRETVLVAARSAGLQAIDGPHLDVGDLEGLAVEAARARALGLDGKWALHPGQVEPINAAFTPAQAEVDRAGAIIDALAGSEGRGAVALDGEMIDEASRKLAAQILARGQAAGLEPVPPEV